MKVAKIKKESKKDQLIQEETYSIKNLIKILIILLLIFGVFYFITTLFVKEKNVNDGNSTGVIDNSKITLSQILSQKENEYYVIATKKSLYDSSYIKTNYIGLYNEYINKYKQKEDSLAFYFVDLDNALNKKYLSDKLNIVDEISELKINDEVLFKIKNKKIEKSYVGKDKIIDKLSRL